MNAPPSKVRLGQLNTPLQPLDRLSEYFGGPRIWIKRDDMTGCATSGNKVRKLEYLFADALAQGCDTIITSGGIQSNHCRATAVLGAQLGVHVHLLLRADEAPQSVGNLFISQLVGAKKSHYSPSEFKYLRQHIDHWMAHYREQNRAPYCIPVGGSNGLGLWGYIDAVSELAADFARLGMQPDAIVHATGSGGTQAGLIVGCQIHEVLVPVVGFAVCDDANYFTTKILSDITDWKRQGGHHLTARPEDIMTIDSYKGPSYGRCDPEVFELIRWLARLEGIILDPVYTGKAFYGMLKEIQGGQFRDTANIVFIHTGGLFGLFAQQDRLEDAAEIYTKTHKNEVDLSWKI